MIVAAHPTEPDLTATGGEPVLRLTRTDGFFEFDAEQCRAAGKALHDSYVSAQPFPHVALDNFIDRAVLDRVNAEFPQPVTGRFADAYSKAKTGYILGMIRSAFIQDLMNALNSAPFLDFLEQMTGIRGLVGDSRFVGGGLHETRRGGHLSIHADFNFHPRTKLRRRLNLILFLNDDWDEEWGGALELWDRSMTRCQKAIAPVIGRAVVFNTDTHSYHGHPDPLATPDGRTRRSIALYYYSMPQGVALPHTTIFRARPGSEDVNTPLVARMKKTLALLMGSKEP